MFLLRDDVKVNVWGFGHEGLDSEIVKQLAQAGLRWFTTHQCGTCHMIAGTDASGRVGPDLTHLASRETIAAGVLPNTPEALARWIANPDAEKKGATMPPTQTDPQTLRALAAYLSSLR